jgi:hypothetical protein
MFYFYRTGMKCYRLGLNEGMILIKFKIDPDLFKIDPDRSDK